MPRADPDLVGDELTLLSQFLEFHRATLVEKVGGLSAEQFGRCAVPTSEITLGGIVKHLALVEDDWSQVRLLGRPDSSHGRAPRSTRIATGTGTPGRRLAGGPARALRRRAHAAAGGGRGRWRPGDPSIETDRETGGRFSLRWIMIHMIEETARHNGHVDLIREAIDGHVGE